jgi:hypothetical protein
MNSQQKSVFSYVTDDSIYINKSKPIYMPHTIDIKTDIALFAKQQDQNYIGKNIDIENDLRGATRLLSKCIEDKYLGEI